MAVTSVVWGGATHAHRAGRGTRRVRRAVPVAAQSGVDPSGERSALAPRGRARLKKSTPTSADSLRSDPRPGPGRYRVLPGRVNAERGTRARRVRVPAKRRPGSPRGAVRGPVGKPVVSSVVKIATRKHSGNRLRMSLRRALVDVFPQKGRGPGWRIHSRRAGLRSYALRNLRGAAHGTRQRPALRRLFTLMGLSGPQPGPTPVCGVRRSASGRARWRATGSPVSLTPCLLMTRRIGPQTGRPVCPFSPGLHPWRSRGAGGPQA